MSRFSEGVKAARYCPYGTGPFACSLVGDFLTGHPAQIGFAGCEGLVEATDDGGMWGRFDHFGISAQKTLLVHSPPPRLVDQLHRSVLRVCICQ